MNTKIVSLLIGAIVVVAIGGFVYAQKEASLVQDPAGMVATSTDAMNTGLTNEEVPASEGEGTQTPVAAEPASQPSLAEIVATHNTRTSCWATINGSVYDLTSWIPRHPGGEGPILALCGTDGSARFNGKHGGESRPQTALAGFRINPTAQ